ncbi:MAG: TonB-dependent receptor domain-containing protein [Acidobacteriota bacterium]
MKSRVMAAIVIPAMFFAPVLAQTQNGNIVGTIRDTSGAAIPGVTVQAVLQQTGVTRSVISEDDGSYRFALVPIGDYTISAELIGFKKSVNRDVHLETNQTLRVDILMEVGELAEEVLVEGRAAVITTDTAELSATQDLEKIQHHPALVYTPSDWSSMATVAHTVSRFSFYGSNTQQFSTTQDGVEYNSANNYVLGYTIQEVKTNVLTSPAKYQTPVTVNLVTKRGTNELHGKLEATLYNTALFAVQDPRAIVKNKCKPGNPCTGYWTSGLNLSGPVFLPGLYDGRDRTFWMATFTNQKDRGVDEPVTYLVPSESWRQGDLSSISATIVDPFTGAPFPGNRIPADMINPVTKKLLAKYPSPVTPGGTLAQGVQRFDKDVWRTWAARVDHNLADSNQISYSITRYMEDASSDFAGRTVPGWIGMAEGKWRSYVQTIGNVHTFSPHLVNEARIGLNHEGPTGYLTENLAPKQIQELGLTGIPPLISNIPVAGIAIDVPGFLSFTGRGSNINEDYHWHVADNLSWSVGQHTFQTGIDYKRSATNREYAGPDNYPTYGFDGRFTGHSFADFLLGLPTGTSRGNLRPVVAQRHNEIGLYLQDDFKVTSRLTLNLGVRYDLITPEYDERGLHYNWDPRTGNIVVPSSDVLGYIDPAWPIATHPIVTADAVGFPTRLVETDTNNIYPRVGFAYRPFDDQTTVVRGGYGIYITPAAGVWGGYLNSGGPFALYTSFQNQFVDGAPLMQWPVGWPAQGGQYTGTRQTMSISGIAKDFVFPYNQQWQLSLEREIFGHGFRVSYIGTKDNKLPYSFNLNALRPSTIPFSWDRYWEQAKIQNYRNATVTGNGGRTQYHGLEAAFKLRKVFGLSADVGFSYAKQMIAGGRDPYCQWCERYRSGNVPQNQLYTQLHWEIPYGKGRQFGSDIPGWQDQVLGNWLLVSNFRFRTGLGFTPSFTGSDPSNTNNFGGLPDLVGDWRLPDDQRGPDRWYNIAAFAVPPSNAGRYGNAGYNLIDGPGFYYLQLGLYKFFPIGERFRIVFSGTSDNALNHPNYYAATQAFNGPNPARLSFARQSYEESSRKSTGYMRNVYFSLGLEF